ncbi:sugar transferase [Vibrio breoganii]|uniref:sugar transferase n=1 Tax=Vibrio breoganii TaxID=553239 RepID=UPI000C81BB47|nr:sugar transferase [Vibrio breoganii]PMO34028.1 sugar transferase [Vibrio breoganii]
MKRSFDLILSSIGIFLVWPLILLGWLLASLSTRSNGFFLQKRVGKDSRIFKVIKLKTMVNSNSSDSSITALNSSRITNTGAFLRRTKLDELPQLLNVLLGDMSFVGPRPDVPGYADKLTGDDRKLLTVRPGITGLATLYFKKEEEILRNISDAKTFNDTVVYPIKVKLNLHYIENWSLKLDIDLILQTVFGTTVFGQKVKPFTSGVECIDFIRSDFNA